MNCAIVSFGEHQKNNDLLTAFINALNGKDGTGSHLVGVPRGKLQIIQGQYATYTSHQTKSSQIMI